MRIIPMQFLTLKLSFKWNNFRLWYANRDYDFEKFHTFVVYDTQSWIFYIFLSRKTRNTVPVPTQVLIWFTRVRCFWNYPGFSSSVRTRGPPLDPTIALGWTIFDFFCPCSHSQTLNNMQQEIFMTGIGKIIKITVLYKTKQIKNFEHGSLDFECKR